MDTQEYLVHAVKLVLQVQTVQKVIQVQLDHVAQKVIKEFLAIQGQKVILVMMEHLAQMARMAHRALLDQEVIRAIRENLAMTVQLQDQKEILANKVLVYNYKVQKQL
jgi:hypothetical protein